MKRTARLLSDVFNHCVSSVSDICRKDGLNDALTFVKLDFSHVDSTMTAIACSGICLKVEVVHDVQVSSDFSAYVLPSTRLPRKNIANIEFSDLSDELIIRCKNTIIGCIQPKLNKPFIDPSEYKESSDLTLSCKLNIDELIKMLRSIKRSNRKNHKNFVTIDFPKSVGPIHFRYSDESFGIMMPMRPYEIFD